MTILDSTFYPVAFPHRQFLELIMKSIFLRYSGKSKQDRANFVEGIQHNLLRIWKEVKPIVSENASASELPDMVIVEDYITQFHKMDSSSFTLRYPTDKKLQLTIVSQHRINLVNLRERMNELDAFLVGYEGKLFEIAGSREEEAEALLAAIY